MFLLGKVHQGTQESIRATHEYFWEDAHEGRMIALRHTAQERVDKGMEWS